MKLTVNFDLCSSNARCMRACPEVFEVRDDGFLYILIEDPPEALHAKVLRAREDCPTGAISFEA